MKKLYDNSKVFCLMLCLLAIQMAANAQALLTSTGYSENFDGIGNNTSWADNNTNHVLGWYTRIVTNNALTTMKVLGPTTDKLNGPEQLFMVNFGSSPASQDRSIGFRVNKNNRPVYAILRLRNTTGKDLNQINIEFDLKTIYNGTGDTPNGMVMSYRKGASGVEGTFTGTTGWTQIENGKLFTNNALPGTTAGLVAPVNHKTLISNISLADQEEIFIRFVDSHTNGSSGSEDDLAIDNVKIIPVRNFYNKPLVSFTEGDVTTWAINRNGTGQTSSDFTSNWQRFIVQHDISLEGPLTVSGEGSKIIVETGKTLTLNGVLTGSIDLEGTAKLIINTGTLPTFGTLSPSSTIVYNGLKTAGNEFGEFENLIIDGRNEDGVNREIGREVTVKGTLSLINRGKLDLKSHNLTVVDPNFIYDSNSFIKTTGKGSVRMKLTAGGSSMIPIGVTTISPVRLTLINGNEDYFKVRTINELWSHYDASGNPSGVKFDSKAVNKTWFVEEENLTDSAENEMKVALYWTSTDAALGFGSEPNIHLGQYVNLAYWSHGPTIPKPVAVNSIFSVERPGLSSLSVFAVYSTALASTPGVLPVELTTFTGSRSGNVVNLAWSTASEKDNDYFKVELSQDGKSFRSLGQVKGNGTTNVAQEYSFTDAAAPAGTVYYRLKQVDFDGKFEYSKVIAVKAAGRATSQASLEAYPNPTSDKVYVTSSKSSGQGTLTVYNSNGKTVLQQKLQVAGGRALLLDLSSQVSGFYTLRLENETGTEVIRVVKH
ncbi:T9SS type A sorting domain-containing protein [Rufibacter latericius]|uniref:T9SS C-terminal target domain-containing protein n=1 Tax=Rufibacter latericius TaxID=2487040 RepID=A0A3M9MTE6_9BACT|nr:T9SS type A sorting domain-containing protein [Rufibacter latericius]RNI28796.1 T9SS C-terminal target domain-containing protein [Rufibacter latericius]